MAHSNYTGSVPNPIVEQALVMKLYPNAVGRVSIAAIEPDGRKAKKVIAQLIEQGLVSSSVDAADDRYVVLEPIEVWRRLAQAMVQPDLVTRFMPSGAISTDTMIDNFKKGMPIGVSFYGLTLAERAYVLANSAAYRFFWIAPRYVGTNKTQKVDWRPGEEPPVGAYANQMDGWKPMLHVISDHEEREIAAAIRRVRAADLFASNVAWGLGKIAGLDKETLRAFQPVGQWGADLPMLGKDPKEWAAECSERVSRARNAVNDAIKRLVACERVAATIAARGGWIAFAAELQQKVEEHLDKLDEAKASNERCPECGGEGIHPACLDAAAARANVGNDVEG